MSALTKAKEPFCFSTRLHLSELTGLRASGLEQLLRLLKEVPGSCIYHHTHRFLQQHQFLSPEPPNDFAYWVSEVLGETELGERLVSIDIMQFSRIHDLREAIVRTVEDYLAQEPSAYAKIARPGEEFHFIKSVSFVMPTGHIAYDLGDFIDILRKITIDAIYFHIFEARLRLERKTNDFSNWIETSLGDKALADELTALDPYTRTLEDLRSAIILMVEKRMSFHEKA